MVVSNLLCGSDCLSCCFWQAPPGPRRPPPWRWSTPASGPAIRSSLGRRPSPRRETASWQWERTRKSARWREAGRASSMPAEGRSHRASSTPIFTSSASTAILRHGPSSCATCARGKRPPPEFQAMRAACRRAPGSWVTTGPARCGDASRPPGNGWTASRQTTRCGWSGWRARRDWRTRPPCAPQASGTRRTANSAAMPCGQSKRPSRSGRENATTPPWRKACAIWCARGSRQSITTTAGTT